MKNDLSQDWIDSLNANNPRAYGRGTFPKLTAHAWTIGRHLSAFDRLAGLEAPTPKAKCRFTPYGRPLKKRR